jgi:peptide/nickel transport system permease protein
MLLIVSLFSLNNLVPILVVAALVWLVIRSRRQPLWAEAYRRMAQNRLALVALTIISLYGAVAVLDSIAWQDNRISDPKTILDRLTAGVPVERTYSAPLATMTTGEPQPHKLIGKHLMGTDGSGRDVLVQTLKGCRTAMLIGGLTSIIIIPIALILGMSAGYYGKRIDDAIQYVYTVMASIPSILLLIALVLVLGKGVVNLCVALGITGWVDLCRLMRGETLKHRDREYVRAARALGMSDARILLRHILPNLLPFVIISITLGFSGLVLNETILSYLGIGVPAGDGSWGNMIDAARNELTREPIIWWNLVSASVALFVLVLAFNFLSDVLRDAIDPRLRSS